MKQTHFATTPLQPQPNGTPVDAESGHGEPPPKK